MRDAQQLIAGIRRNRGRDTVVALPKVKIFVGELEFDARFFTNRLRDGNSSRGWTPLTESTFDAGMLGVDRSTTGVLAVQDED